MPPQRFAGRDKTPQVRVVFRPPPDFDVLTSLWAKVETSAGGKATVTLIYDYPDFAPAAGWKVEVGDKTYQVTAADGRELDCTEGGV